MISRIRLFLHQAGCGKADVHLDKFGPELL
jgi:hypothetical protein